MWSKKSTKDNRENRIYFHCGKFGRLKKNCWNLKADKNKSVATDTMGLSSVDDTLCSEFSAVRVNSMRLTDNLLCDSVASHHMTANKQYFATYKMFCLQSIYRWQIKNDTGFGSVRVNVEILVEDKYCPGYLEDIFTPPIMDDTCSRYVAAEHGIRFVIKRQRVTFQCNGQRVATGGWMTRTPRICALRSQDCQRKLTLQQLRKLFRFGMNNLAIKTNVLR